MIQIDEHPLLRARAFVTRFDRPIGEIASPDWLKALLREDADTPLVRDEELRVAIRDLLRHGGYRPTGRGKPSSEYLVRAASEGALGSINPAVDACNAVSLASGIPISVVDGDLVQPPLRIGVADPGAAYVFNAAGQMIDLEGLICLFDLGGPCANAVKDSQRTKTNDRTTRTLSVLWGSKRAPERVDAAFEFHREVLARLGASTEIAV
jgi:DNA/RNA-binding domain of Phe-tRNA-synthetase-like protein